MSLPEYKIAKVPLPSVLSASDTVVISPADSNNVTLNSPSLYLTSSVTTTTTLSVNNISDLQIAQIASSRSPEKKKRPQSWGSSSPLSVKDAVQLNPTAATATKKDLIQAWRSKREQFDISPSNTATSVPLDPVTVPDNVKATSEPSSPPSISISQTEEDNEGQRLKESNEGKVSESTTASMDYESELDRMQKEKDQRADRSLTASDASTSSERPSPIDGDFRRRSITPTTDEHETKKQPRKTSAKIFRANEPKTPSSTPSNRTSSRTPSPSPAIRILEEIVEPSSDEKETMKEQLRNNNTKRRTTKGEPVKPSEINKKKQIIIGDYQLGEVIGRGASGVVFKGLRINTGDFVAIKQINKLALRHTDLASVKRELYILQKIQHPNIVKVLDCIETSEQLNLIFEYIENGSLTAILEKFGAFPESLIAVYTSQLLAGLAYLHEKGLVHRDVKAANILITKDGIIKLSDFGVAIDEQKDEEGLVAGSPYWMAPEVIEITGQTRSSDVWSVGCTVIELLTCCPPYFDLSPMAAMFKIVEDSHPPLPEGITLELKDFLLLCFHKDPKKRATAKELLSHPWIQQSVAKAKRQSKSFALKSFEDLRTALIEYNQNNPDKRFQTLRGYRGNEDDLNFHELARAPLPTLKDQPERRPSLKKSFTTSTPKPEPFAILKEGILKSKHKYWCVILNSVPLLYYYKKKENYLKGKPPKGQILLVGCEVYKSDFISREPFGFVISQRDARRFYLCAESEEDQLSWVNAISGKEAHKQSPELESFKELVNQQAEMIKKLQKGIQTLVERKEEKALKRPNERFYKEFFFFLVLSTRRNENIATHDLNIQALYERAQEEHIPFHMWYEWIPKQLKRGSNDDAVALLPVANTTT